MLAAMREAIAQLLPDTCTVLSVTRTPDGMGGQSETWGTASANVACRLDMKTGRELVTGEALQPYSYYMLSVPYNTAITTADRILHNSVTYAVTSANLNQSWQAVKRVQLERI